MKHFGWLALVALVFCTGVGVGVGFSAVGPFMVSKVYPNPAPLISTNTPEATLTPVSAATLMPVATPTWYGPISAKKPLGWTPEPAPVRTRVLLDSPEVVRGAYYAARDRIKYQLSPLWTQKWETYTPSAVGLYYWAAVNAIYKKEAFPDVTTFYQQMFSGKDLTAGMTRKIHIEDTIGAIYNIWDRNDPAYEYVTDPKNNLEVWFIFLCSDGGRIPYGFNYDLQAEWAKYSYQRSLRPSLTWPDYLWLTFGQAR